MIVVLAACGAGPDLEGPELDPVERLARASMILRGVRPSADELRAVAGTPALLEDHVDAWLDDPRFGATVRELHEHAWRTQSELLQLPASGSLRAVEMSRLRASLLSAPARMAEEVVMRGLPYTDTVTADWFVADAVVAAAWPGVVGFDLARPDDWQPVWIDDGRPRAGLLSDSGLWMRFRSPNTNYNRQRANALSTALLCHDFLEVEASGEDGGVDLSDLAAAEDAIATVPACVACHQDLDGLAGFFPFEPFWPVPEMVFPYPVYDEVHETEWQRMSGRPPSYFGLGGGDLADLGRRIADDPRFAECAARRFYGWFAQLDPEDVPDDVARELGGVLVDSGFDGKALARAAVLHPSLADDDRGVLTATPRQLGAMVEELTGFRWEADVDATCCDADAGSSRYGTVDLSSDQYVGFDVVGGGFDGDAVLTPARTPSVGGLAFQRRLAEHAAGHVIAQTRPALLDVDPDAADEGDVRRALVALHLRVLREDVARHSPEVDETWALWSAVHASTRSPRRAWGAVLVAMLRDVRAGTY